MNVIEKGNPNISTNNVEDLNAFTIEFKTLYFYQIWLRLRQCFFYSIVIQISKKYKSMLFLIHMIEKIIETGNDETDIKAQTPSFKIFFFY